MAADQKELGPRGEREYHEPEGSGVFFTEQSHPEAIKEIYGGVRTSDADLTRAAELARGEDKRGLFVGHVSSHAFRIQKTGGVHH